MLNLRRTPFLQPFLPPSCYLCSPSRARFPRMLEWTDITLLASLAVVGTDKPCISPAALRSF